MASEREGDAFLQPYYVRLDMRIKCDHCYVVEVFLQTILAWLHTLKMHIIYVWLMERCHTCQGAVSTTARVAGQLWAASHDLLIQEGTTNFRGKEQSIAQLVPYYWQPETADLNSVNCLSKFIKWYSNANISLLSYSHTAP
jgi:hypothetical protein